MIMTTSVQLQYAGDMLKALSDERVRKCLSKEELNHYYRKIAIYLMALIDEKV